MADSEVTPSLADVIAQHWTEDVTDEIQADERLWLQCECSVKIFHGADEWAAHLAAALQASFLVLPKDQLHQEWGYSDDEDPDELFGWFSEEIYDDAEEDARNAAKNKGGKVFQRWVGPWRPADSKEG